MAKRKVAKRKRRRRKPTPEENRRAQEAEARAFWLNNKKDNATTYLRREGEEMREMDMLSPEFRRRKSIIDRTLKEKYGVTDREIRGNLIIKHIMGVE